MSRRAASSAGKNWTANQLKAIELLAGGGLTLSEIQKELHISQDTLWRWRKNPLFTEAVLKRSREMLRESLPKVYKTLAEKASSGDPRHMKTLLDHLEYLEKTGEQYRGGSITVVWKDTWDEGESTDPSTES